MGKSADAKKIEEVMRAAWTRNLSSIAEGLAAKSSEGNYQAVHVLYKLAGYGVLGGERAQRAARQAPKKFLLDLMQTIVPEEKPVELQELDRSVAGTEVTDDAEGEACSE